MEHLDLSGIWEMSLTSDRGGRPPAKYDDVIRLPDSTSRAHKGPKSEARFSGYLTDPYAFEGCLWVRREVVAPENWEGMEITLMLERTRRTSLFLDGKRIGAQNSLCTPHRYVLPALTRLPYAGDRGAQHRLSHTRRPYDLSGHPDQLAGHPGQDGS